MILINRQQTSFGILLSALMFSLTFGAAFTSQANEPPAWKVIKIFQEKNSEKHSRGMLLYTTGADKTGAAFRCEGGKLFAFMAVKPVDFRNILQQRSNDQRNREVSFRINDADLVTEDWVQLYRGQIYMPREVSTTHDIFRTSTTGATMIFTRKYGKTVTIPLPKLEEATANHFLEICKLKGRYRLKELAN